MGRRHYGEVFTLRGMSSSLEMGGVFQASVMVEARFLSRGPQKVIVDVGDSGGLDAHPALVEQQVLLDLVYELGHASAHFRRRVLPTPHPVGYLSTAARASAKSLRRASCCA